MNSKELVSAALGGLPVSRVPTGPLAVHFCAGLAGHSLSHYTTSATAMAESILRYYDRFKPDAVWLSADTWVSAEAMGPGSAPPTTTSLSVASATHSSGRPLISTVSPRPT